MAHVLAVHCDNVAPAISLVATVSPTREALHLQIETNARRTNFQQGTASGNLVE